MYVYLYIVINDNESAVWCKAKRSNVMSAYTFFTNLILNERVYFFLSKRLGKLVLKDIYYKFSMWFIIHIFILCFKQIYQMKKKIAKTVLKTKVHLLIRILAIYTLFPSLLMLRIKSNISTKRCSRMTHNKCLMA